MAIDVNEISGFVSNSNNVAYLTDLYNHVAARLRMLGVEAYMIQTMPLGTQQDRKHEATRGASPERDELAFLTPAPVQNQERSRDEPSEKAEPPQVIVESEPAIESKKSMPDYSSFPAALRALLEKAWATRMGNVT